MKEQLVLVGNGMAGVRTLEELLKLAPDRYDKHQLFFHGITAVA